jgi:hypothetical protein
MKRWIHPAVLSAFLSPLALGGEVGESTRPAVPKGCPAGCCGKSCDKACPAAPTVPNDDEQACRELVEIIRTTESPDTFTAAVVGLLGTNGTAGQRYARRAAPVVIRSAERLGVLKGLASSGQPTPAQEALLDYLEGMAAMPPEMAAVYGGAAARRAPGQRGAYSPVPPPPPPSEAGPFGWPQPPNPAVGGPAPATGLTPAAPGTPLTTRPPT